MVRKEKGERRYGEKGKRYGKKERKAECGVGR